MSNAVAIEQPRQKSVLIDMAGRFGMEPQAFELTVRKTCGAEKCTREEFAAFLLVAKEYKLNPILKEIYAFPKRGGGIVPVVSIDGWVNLINSHPQCDGFEFEWDHDGQGKPISCTCRMYRKDRSHPTMVTEYYDECHRPTDPWKMAHRMLRHKALIQAARYAFGFAGIYDEDEAARIAQMKDVTPATERPKLSDYREQAGAADAEATSSEPTETDSGDPFFFTDAYGEKKEEPLDEEAFFLAVADALDQCTVGAAVTALLEHNQEGIDRLSDQGKELLHDALDQANRRCRDAAVDAEREASKEAQAKKDAEKAAAKPTEASKPESAKDEAKPDKTAQDAAAAPQESENPAPAAEAPKETKSFVIPIAVDAKGEPQDKEYYAALIKAFRAATVPNDVRRIWQANKADIEKCRKYWQGEIEKAARERAEALEKA